MKKNLLPLILILSLAAAASALDFSHEVHVTDSEMECAACHPSFTTRAVMPEIGACLDCHEPEDVAAALTPSPLSHFGDYRHEHAFDASANTGDCAFCHSESEECILCHHGENLDFLAHDRNHRYNHALDALKGIEDCMVCHADQSYCNGCHLSEGVKPASHFLGNFSTSTEHSAAAREDIESCILCHGGPTVPPSCSGTACHPLN